MSAVSASEINVFKRFGKKLVFPTFLAIDAWNNAIKKYKDMHKMHCLPLNFSAPVRYGEETVIKFLKTKKWIFVFDPGFSIRKIFGIIGTDSESAPFFASKNTWWLEEEWAFAQSDPAFRLVSRPTFRGCAWEEQEKMIKAMGDDFCRASLRTAVVAGITWALLDHLRIPMGGCQHWSGEGDDFIGKVFFDFEEFSFAVWPRRCFAGGLGACITRKFDF